MAYSDFTLETLRRDCQVEYKRVDFFTRPFRQVEPSQLLAQMIGNSLKTLPLLTEKAKSEFLIAPVLYELHTINPHRFTIYSGFSFDVNEKLYGYCDYLLGSQPASLTVDAPIFCVVEAKNRSIEEGLGQCGAEMYAAWLFNQQTGKPIKTVFGTVTNGYDWVFLRFQGDALQIDLDRFSISNLPELIGVLQTIVESYL